MAIYQPLFLNHLAAIATLTRHTNIVCGIAISPNGPILAGAYMYDNTARLWKLEILSPKEPE